MVKIVYARLHRVVNNAILFSVFSAIILKKYKDKNIFMTSLLQDLELKTVLKWIELAIEKFAKIVNYLS